MLPASLLSYLAASSALDGGGILGNGDVLVVGTTSAVSINVDGWTIIVTATGQFGFNNPVTIR